MNREYIQSKRETRKHLYTLIVKLKLFHEF